MKYERFFYDWNPSFFLEVLKVQFPCNHLYHRIFQFVSSSPACHVFLWTFRTSYTLTYSHSKKYPSRAIKRYNYSTRTWKFIIRRQIFKWKFQLWEWHVLCWLRICITCRLISPAVAYRGGEGGWVVQTPPSSKFRSFDKVESDCKLSGKYLVFLFQHRN